MKVVFFHRKPRPHFNFSVENLFKEVRSALPADVTWNVVEMKYYSDGLFKRLYICFQAMLSQQDVSHITGDVNFIAIFLKKKRTVLTILDLGLMNHPNKLKRFVLQWLWVILPVWRSSVITTISEATRKELLKFVKVDPSRVKVVYVPISSLFKPFPKPFNKECPRILQVGTKSNKNILRLAQALKGIPCILEIIGEVSAELREELSRSAVHYTSSMNISNQEVIEKYKACDILSFVSTYEGFGMPIVEANAVGRVVVTSNILSMPEVAGDAAHLVDPFDVNAIHDGIVKVINDHEYRERLIANGFENQKRFDVKQIGIQYADIYRDLAKK